MIQPIIQYPDQILLGKSLPLSTCNNSVTSVLCKNILDTMLSVNGSGLAAPQINMPFRAFVVNNMTKNGQLANGQASVFLNPQIISHSDSVCQVWEGCLSYENGHRSVEVSRYNWISVSWRDPWKFKVRFATLYGLPAVIWQHEFDHLEGRGIWEHDAGAGNTKDGLPGHLQVSGPV